MISLWQTLTCNRSLNCDADRRSVTDQVGCTNFILEAVPPYKVSVRRVVNRAIRVDNYISIERLRDVCNGVREGSIRITVIVKDGNGHCGVRPSLDFIIL